MSAYLIIGVRQAYHNIQACGTRLSDTTGDNHGTNHITQGASFKILNNCCTPESPSNKLNRSTVIGLLERGLLDRRFLSLHSLIKIQCSICFVA